MRDPSSAAPEAYLMVRVVTRDGEQVIGMRVNEDAFSIQLRDEDSRYHSFRKRDLAGIDKQPDRTFMPRYQSLFAAS